MLCIILLYNYSIAGFNSPSRSDILMLLGLNSIFVPPIWYIFILNMMLQYLLELFLIHHKCKSFLPWQSVWCCSIIIWQETCYAAGSLLTSCHSTANSSQSHKIKQYRLPVPSPVYIWYVQYATNIIIETGSGFVVSSEGIVKHQQYYCHFFVFWMSQTWWQNWP